MGSDGTEHIQGIVHAVVRAMVRGWVAHGNMEQVHRRPMCMEICARADGQLEAEVRTAGPGECVARRPSNAAILAHDAGLPDLQE